MAGKTFSLNSEIKLSLKFQVKLKKSHVFFKRNLMLLFLL